jgi:hypothetical protein
VPTFLNNVAGPAEGALAEVIFEYPESRSGNEINMNGKMAASMSINRIHRVTQGKFVLRLVKKLLSSPSFILKKAADILTVP